MTNKNQVITLEPRQYIEKLDDEEKKKIKEIFELFDKNLDGGIDIKELKFILNSMQ
jgi:Ca2+-binding EF-hand superfamily protein